VFRIGLGTDIHPFEKGRKLMLGGVEIPHDKGMSGHSDGDCVLHAIGDALLGAAALGDLGEHFPPNEENKNRPSSEILNEICLKVWAKGFRILNVDVVIMTEEPRISSHREKMQEHIAPLLNIDKSAVGIKATTCDGLGAIGRKEGVMTQAVVLLEKKVYE
jgi:2-C-methyl-D-erythritol 2,4-cyclodiphosphate synthase